MTIRGWKNFELLNVSGLSSVCEHTMKPKNYIILPIVASAISLTNCSKKSEGEKPKEETSKSTPVKTEDAAQPTAPDAPKTEEQPVEQPAVSVEQVAAKTGFAKHLPKGSVMVMNLQKGAEITKKLRGSALGQLVEQFAKSEGNDINDVTEDPSFQEFATIAGEEVFFGIGEGGDQWLEGFIKLSAESNFYQMEALVKLADKALGTGEEEEADSGMMMAMGMREAFLLEMFKSKDVQQMLSDLHMAPVYVGFKVSDDEKRQGYVKKLQGFADEAMQGMPFPILDEAKSDAGNGFKGFVVKGDEIAKLMETEGKEEMEKTLGEEAFKAYVDIISKKKLTFLVGEVDKYVVIFVGGTAEQLKLAKTADESMLADAEMGFTKQFAEKDIIGLLYSSSSMQKVGYEHGGYLKDLVRGILSGLKTSENFGDTRVLEALLGDVVAKENTIMAEHKASRMGAVAYLEEGFKVDFFGGDNAPAYDFESKRTLAPLTQGDDILFSASWVTNPAYMDKVLEYFDAIGSSSYQIAKQVSTLKVDEADFNEFQQGFTMFDNDFKDDALAIWKALRVDLTAGLGSESAIVVDINGEMPSVPEVPAPIIKNGKIPRIAFVSTVDDRAKLAGSWDNINKAAESLLAKVEKFGGPKIPMQRPMLSESKDLASWSFPVPFTHQNCLPSLSLSDKLFVASTSPDFSKQLVGKYDAAKTGEAGAEMVLNFGPAFKLAADWVKLIDAEGKGFLSEHELKEFQEGKEIFEKCLKASEEVEKLTIKCSKKNGEVHSTLHLKTR